eukprot:g40526.t1
MVAHLDKFTRKGDPTVQFMAAEKVREINGCDNAKMAKLLLFSLDSRLYKALSANSKKGQSTFATIQEVILEAMGFNDGSPFQVAGETLQAWPVNCFAEQDSLVPDWDLGSAPKPGTPSSTEAGNQAVTLEWEESLGEATGHRPGVIKDPSRPGHPAHGQVPVTVIEESLIYRCLGGTAPTVTTGGSKLGAEGQSPTSTDYAGFTYREASIPCPRINSTASQVRVTMGKWSASAGAMYCFSRERNVIFGVRHILRWKLGLQNQQKVKKT